MAVMLSVLKTKLLNRIVYEEKGLYNFLSPLFNGKKGMF